MALSAAFTPSGRRMPPSSSTKSASEKISPCPEITGKISARLGRFLAVCTSISPIPLLNLFRQILCPRQLHSTNVSEEVTASSICLQHRVHTPQDEFQARKPNTNSRCPLCLCLHISFEVGTKFIEKGWGPGIRARFSAAASHHEPAQPDRYPQFARRPPPPPQIIRHRRGGLKRDDETNLLRDGEMGWDGMGWEGGRRGREWKSNQQLTGLSSQTVRVRGLRNAERRLLRSTNDEILSEYFLTLRPTSVRWDGREGLARVHGGRRRRRRERQTCPPRARGDSPEK